MTNKIILVTDDKLSQSMSECRKEKLEVAGYEVEVKSLWELQSGYEFSHIFFDEYRDSSEFVEDLVKSKFK